jgi:hypothetical protein
MKGSKKPRTLRIVIYLWIENGKIVRHEDRFDNEKPTTKEEKLVEGTVKDVS